MHLRCVIRRPVLARIIYGVSTWITKTHPIYPLVAAKLDGIAGNIRQIDKWAGNGRLFFPECTTFTFMELSIAIANRRTLAHYLNSIPTADCWCSLVPTHVLYQKNENNFRRTRPCQHEKPHNTGSITMKAAFMWSSLRTENNNCGDEQKSSVCFVFSLHNVLCSWASRRAFVVGWMQCQFYARNNARTGSGTGGGTQKIGEKNKIGKQEDEKIIMWNTPICEFNKVEGDTHALILPLVALYLNPKTLNGLSFAWHCSLTMTPLFVVVACCHIIRSSCCVGKRVSVY